MSRFVCFILSICCSQMAFSHVGSHSSEISIEVLSAAFNQKSADIDLVLTNASHDAISIKSIKTNVGKVEFALNYPLDIPSQNQFSFTNTLSLTVENPVFIPQIFTLIFDFGDAGSGPITIIPTSFKE